MFFKQEIVVPKPRFLSWLDHYSRKDVFLSM